MGNKRLKANPPAAGGRGQWEGTFGEFTYGKRWVLSSGFPDDLHRASLNGQLVSLEGSVAGSPVGLRPYNRPPSLWCFVHLACSGLERSFGKRFRTVFSSVGGSWGSRGPGLGCSRNPRRPPGGPRRPPGGPRRPPGGPQEAPGGPQEAPGGPQEAPGGPQEVPGRAPRGARRAPGGPQGGPGRPRGSKS